MNYRNVVLFLPTINYWNRIIHTLRFFMHNNFNIKRSIILRLKLNNKRKPRHCSVWNTSHDHIRFIAIFQSEIIHFISSV